MFFLVYFYAAYGSVNSVTFTSPAHLEVHHFQLFLAYHACVTVRDM